MNLLHHFEEVINLLFLDFLFTVETYLSPVETHCMNIDYFVPDTENVTKGMSDDSLSRLREYHILHRSWPTLVLAYTGPGLHWSWTTLVLVVAGLTHGQDKLFWQKFGFGDHSIFSYPVWSQSNLFVSTLKVMSV